MHAGQPLELALGLGAARRRAGFGLLDPLPELVDLGVLGLAFAQLFLDRLDLLAEEVVALGLGELASRPAPGSWSKAPGPQAAARGYWPSRSSRARTLISPSSVCFSSIENGRLEPSRSASRPGSRVFIAATWSSSGICWLWSTIRWKRRLTWWTRASSSTPSSTTSSQRLDLTDQVGLGLDDLDQPGADTAPGRRSASSRRGT